MRRPLALVFAMLVLVSCAEPPPSWESQRARTGGDLSPPAATFTPDPVRGITAAADLQRWEATVLWDDTATWNATVAANEKSREDARRAAPTTAPRVPRARPQLSTSSGRCGGDLPPCWVMNRESGGDIHAYNPTGCSGRGCYGKWQCDPRTCSGTGTEAQQDAEARALWDGGRGCAHWDAC